MALRPNAAGGKRAVIGVIVAYALALQALLLAMGSAHHVLPNLGGADEIICTFHDGADGHDELPADSPQHADCCILADSKSPAISVASMPLPSVSALALVQVLTPPIRQTT